MTWGDVKLAALQTMYSNEGAVLTEDDINREYINAMPAKANEALQQIASVGRPILKSWQIEVDADTDEPVVTAEKLILPKTKDLYKIPLQDYLPRFRSLNSSEVMFADGTAYGTAEDWSMEGDDVFVIPGSVVGTYTLWYKAYPQTVTADTPESLADEALSLLDDPARLARMSAALRREQDCTPAEAIYRELKKYEKD